MLMHSLQPVTLVFSRKFTFAIQGLPNIRNAELEYREFLIGYARGQLEPYLESKSSNHSKE